MSTGMDAAVVTNPENMEAKKWQNIPSLTYPENEKKIYLLNAQHNHKKAAHVMVLSSQLMDKSNCR